MVCREIWEGSITMAKVPIKSHILRVKIQDYDCWSYVNHSLIIPKTSFSEPYMTMEHFLLSKRDAEMLAMDVIRRKEELNMKQLAIVEVIQSKSYPEMNVIFYREFD